MMRLDAMAVLTMGVGIGIAILSRGAMEPNEAARMQCRELLHQDVGATAAGQQHIAYHFVNTGTAIVKAPRITASCSCIRTRFSAESVPPGGEATMTATVTLASPRDSSTGTVHLVWSDQSHTEVTFAVTPARTSLFLCLPAYVEVDPQSEHAIVCSALVDYFPESLPDDFSLCATTDAGVKLEPETRTVVEDADGIGLHLLFPPASLDGVTAIRLEATGKDPISVAVVSLADSSLMPAGEGDDAAAVFRRRSAIARERCRDKVVYGEQRMVLQDAKEARHESILTWSYLRGEEIQQWWPLTDEAREACAHMDSSIESFCREHEPNMLIANRSYRPSYYYPTNNRRDPGNPKHRESGWLRVDNDIDYVAAYQARLFHLMGKDPRGRWLDAACLVDSAVARLADDVFLVTYADHGQDVVQVVDIDEHGRISRYGVMRTAEKAGAANAAAAPRPTSPEEAWRQCRFVCEAGRWSAAYPDLPSSVRCVSQLAPELRALDIEYSLVWRASGESAGVLVDAGSSHELGTYSRGRPVVEVIDRHLIMSPPNRPDPPPQAKVEQRKGNALAFIGATAGYLLVGLGMWRMFKGRKGSIGSVRLALPRAPMNAT
jgi:Protein of unknown function (DUF1573)